MLKKYIKESFFNPTLHILPIIVFLLLLDFVGLDKAWVFTVPVILLSLGYVFAFYRSILQWFLLSVGLFALVALPITFLSVIQWEEPVSNLLGEVIAIIILTAILLIKKQVYQLVVAVTNKKLAMMNNVNELYRLTRIYVIIISTFVIAYFYIFYMVEKNREESFLFIKQVFYFLLVLTIIYEMIRVFSVREQLMKEEWWPIVNLQGKEIGSIQYHNSLWTEKDKFTHPVVRVIVIEGNKLFLQQHSYRHPMHGKQWDNAIGSHLRVGESPVNCAQRIAKDTYGVDDFNPVFLANYKIENDCEFQYVHLFITCRMGDIQTDPSKVLHVKWWTVSQIIEELNSGIFTDNFVREFELLQRSGLIEAGKCNCDCKLRDTVLKF